MTCVKKPNIFNIVWGTIKFVIFAILVGLQFPIILLMPRRVGVRYMRFFMRILTVMSGIRIRVHGELTTKRPLLVVSNHISLFEMATFPIVFGGSFVAKKEVESWPVAGPIARKFGVIFIDRRPSHAVEALKTVRECVKSVAYPMFVFPEGTTTNGAYVKPFKSSLFNFVENSDVVVQPVVMHYRHRNGDVISDQELADHFAYFANAKMDMGPLCKRERSACAQLLHIMILGGFMMEITVLDPIPLGGMDRKQIAATLQEKVSEKYMELKDKKAKK